MENEVVLTNVFYYLRNLPAPEMGMSKKSFDKNSYSIWAANEIASMIIEEVSAPPPHITGREPTPALIIIEEFMCEMEYYYDLSRKEMFLIASRTAEEILNLFL